MSAVQATRCTDEELTRRAMSAYFREGARNGWSLDQPAGSSGVVEVDGEMFVELHNCNGTLAIYRVLDSGRPAIRKVQPDEWPSEYQPQD